MLNINRVGVANYNSIGFTGKKSTEEAPKEAPSSKKASNFVTIPTAVFLTLSPSLMNAQEPIYNDSIPQEHICQCDECLFEEEEPFYTSDEFVRQSQDFKMDGKKYSINYIGMDDEDFNRISDIYIVPKSDSELPMRIEQLVVHRPEKGGFNFLGAIVSEQEYGELSEYNGLTKKEIRLPDEVSGDLLDFYFGKNTDFYMLPVDRQDIKVSTTDDLIPEYRDFK